MLLGTGRKNSGKKKKTCKASRTASSGKQTGNVFNIFHDGKEDEKQGEAGLIS